MLLKVRDYQKQRLYPQLEQYLSLRTEELGSLAEERKPLLAAIVNYLREQQKAHHPLQLVFVCTHNSRRSMLAQLWAQTAAHVTGIKNLKSFSCGSEATALHPNTVAAMRRAGFKVVATMDGHNPIYNASFSPAAPSLLLYSKTAEKAMLPKGHFAAVMVCQQDAESCPLIREADRRFPLPYEDPGRADGTAQADEAYDAVCRQIATEMLWLFRSLSAA